MGPLISCEKCCRWPWMGPFLPMTEAVYKDKWAQCHNVVHDKTADEIKWLNIAHDENYWWPWVVMSYLIDLIRDSKSSCWFYCQLLTGYTLWPCIYGASSYSFSWYIVLRVPWESWKCTTCCRSISKVHSCVSHLDSRSLIIFSYPPHLFFRASTSMFSLIIWSSF